MEPRRAPNLLDLVAAHADLEGRTESPHPGLWFWRRDRPSPPIASQTYSPVLAVIVQGRKVAHFAGRAYAEDIQFTFSHPTSILGILFEFIQYPRGYQTP